MSARVGVLVFVMMILGSMHAGFASAFTEPVYVPTASIDRLEYPSHVVVDEHFEVTVSMHYWMPSGRSIHLEIVAPTSHDMPLDWDSWDVPPLSNEGDIVKTFDVYLSSQLANPGRMALSARAFHCPSGGGDCTDLTRRDFEIDVASGSPSVDILDIQYVKDTIGYGEITPVVVKAKYSNLYDTTSLAVAVYELSTGSYVAGQPAPEKFSGTGTYTFRPLSIAPPAVAGDWELRVWVSAESAEEIVADAKEEITISVVGALQVPQSAQVEITTVLTPPGTLAVGESAPVTVSAQYSGLPAGTKLMLWFKDQSTGEQLSGSTTSGLLSGSSTYKFKPVNVKPTTPGDWHLQALVDLAGDTTATKAFTINVEGAPLEAEIRITSVKQPPGTLRVGETAPLTVKISYENLAPGTKLTVIVHDNDAHKDLASVRSIALSGTGTYTFPNISIKPTREGSWHLGVMISGHSETRTNITIKVVK